MKVLWVSNSAIGPAATVLNRAYSGSSGGWIKTVYEEIQNQKYEMYFLCTDNIAKKGQYIHKSGEIGQLYCVPTLKISYGVRPPKSWSALIQKVINEIKPDLIHIWGTETVLSNEVAKLSGDIPKVVFIQGLLGVHQRYLGGRFSDIQNKKYAKNISVFEKLKTNLRAKFFRKQVAIEQDTILRAKNVIIDSSFSSAYCQSISDKIDEFYYLMKPNQLFFARAWNFENVERNSIFTIYAGNPEKGLPQLLKALEIVKRNFPQIKLYVPGPFNKDECGRLIHSKKGDFESALDAMVVDLQLENNVVFLGKLTPEQMADRLSQSHIFVSPSCMEVHSMGLREALTVGAPSISSYCGSIPEFIQHRENGYLYRYEEYEQLAYYIQHLLMNRDNCLKVSANAKKALKGMEEKLISGGAQFLKIKDIYKAVVERSIHE